MNIYFSSFSLYLPFYYFQIFFDLSFTFIEILIFISIGIVFNLDKKFVLTSLDNVSSSVFFINNRIFTSILILIISYFVFDDKITIFQFLGLVLGIFVFLLLFDKEDKSRKSSNFKKGIFFLGLCILSFSYSNLAIKYGISHISILKYLLAFSFSCFLFSIIFYYKKNFNEIIKIKKIINY